MGEAEVVGAPDGAVDKLGSCERVGFAEGTDVGMDVGLTVGDRDGAEDGWIDRGIEGGCVREGTRFPVNIMERAATSFSRDDHLTRSSSSA